MSAPHESVYSAHDELVRFKRTIADYKRWLSEFPDIVTVLENLEITVQGKQSLCASHPPSKSGPWSTPSLREVLRERRAAAMQQLFATIKKSSRYAHQQPRDDSQRVAPPIPFEVEIGHGPEHDYIVFGNGNQYRIADLHFFVKAGERFVRLTR